MARCRLGDAYEDFTDSHDIRPGLRANRHRGHRLSERRQDGSCDTRHPDIGATTIDGQAPTPDVVELESKLRMGSRGVPRHAPERFCHQLSSQAVIMSQEQLSAGSAVGRQAGSNTRWDGHALMARDLSDVHDLGSFENRELYRAPSHRVQLHEIRQQCIRQKPVTTVGCRSAERTQTRSHSVSAPTSLDHVRTLKYSEMTMGGGLRHPGSSRQLRDAEGPIAVGTEGCQQLACLLDGSTAILGGAINSLCHGRCRSTHGRRRVHVTDRSSACWHEFDYRSA